ncbi:MAG TPA: hypothetical protein VEA69_18945 [Tepidisphaeraceae bacterium]|nr:hypothetical protein [Tepidisphaeraceae bacterium]
MWYDRAGVGGRESLSARPLICSDSEEASMNGPTPPDARSRGAIRAQTLVLTIVALLAVAALVLRMYTGPGTRVGPPPPPPAAAYLFYAVVRNEADAPVIGARVVVRTAVMHAATAVGMGGGGRVRWAESVPQVLTSGPGGAVTVTLPPGHAVLGIESVESPGFDQVLEQVPHTLRPEAATRYYEYEGPDVTAHVYKSDPDRPAIIRLHPRGSAVPVGTIARGGFDLPRNAPPIINKPVLPHIPSAGPGAPVDQDDRARRVNAWAADPRNWPKH